MCAKQRVEVDMARGTGAKPLVVPESTAAADGGERRTDVADAARVLRRFRQVFNAVKTHFQQVERQAGIGGAQLWALSVVGAQPGIGVGGLAAAMDIHQTTASNLVKSLVSQQLLVAQRDGQDRRAVRLRITAQGDTVLRKAPGPFAGVLPDALAALDSQTLQRLDHDLGMLLARLQSDDGSGRIPLGQQ
jgi:DNA-binding MarR family transcriptional regulator